MKNMTSKAQERKALEEIKAILLQLEPDDTFEQHLRDVLKLQNPTLTTIL